MHKFCSTVYLRVEEHAQNARLLIEICCALRVLACSRAHLQYTWHAHGVHMHTYNSVRMVTYISSAQNTRSGIIFACGMCECVCTKCSRELCCCCYSRSPFIAWHSKQRYDTHTKLIFATATTNTNPPAHQHHVSSTRDMSTYRIATSYTPPTSDENCTTQKNKSQNWQKVPDIFLRFHDRGIFYTRVGVDSG